MQVISIIEIVFIASLENSDVFSDDDGYQNEKLLREHPNIAYYGWV